MSDRSVKAPEPGGTPAPMHRNMQANPPNGTGAANYFRKGFGLKSEIQSELDSDYTGHLVDLLKARDYTLTYEDVVILPAFGVTIRDFEALRQIGCVMVDTTCGSVLNVWKRVENYARDGFTSLIHGKYYHEETRATASQAEKYDSGHYFIVRNIEEAQLVCDFS